jgi:hypothetical protein
MSKDKSKKKDKKKKKEKKSPAADVPRVPTSRDLS